MSTVRFGTNTVDGKTVAGNVLQVISTSTGTSISNTSGSWVNAGVDVTITPKYNTSKILLIYSTCVNFYSSNAIYSSCRLVRPGNALRVWEDAWGQGINAYASMYQTFNFRYIDSPATTSATTYSVEFLVRTGASIYSNYVNINGGMGTLTAMEIQQ